MEEKPETTARNDGEVVIDYILGEFKLTMWVPDELAGRVVGKKGVTITNLQRETKAKLINALQPVGGSLWAPVVIIGEWKSITAAYKAISEMVFDEVDDVVLEFTVNTRKPFFLYGKQKYHTIKVISAKSNVRIFVPENLKEHPVPPVTLEGSFENVHKALVFLEDEALGYRERQKEKMKNIKQASENAQANNSTSAVAPATTTATTTATTASSGNKEREKSIVTETVTKRSESNKVGVEIKKTANANVTKSTSAPSSSSIAQADSVAGGSLKAVTTEALGDSTNKKEVVVVTEESSTKGDFNVSTVANTANETAAADNQTTDSSKDKTKEKEGSTLNGGNTHAKSLKSIRVTIERLIQIPSNLVGLLLSKRNVKSSVMNHIQALTNTTISKVLPPAVSTMTSSAVSGNGDASTAAVADADEVSGKDETSKSGNVVDRGSRRRALADDDRNAENDGEEDEEDDGSVQSSGSSESTDTSAVSQSSEEEGASSAPSEIEKGKTEEKKRFDENEPPVPFRIIGQNAKYVDIAFDQLTRIIKGDRIKEVMDALVLQTASLHPHPTHHFKDSNREYKRSIPGSGSGRGIGGRERERDRGRGGERGGEKKREAIADRGAVGKDAIVSKDEGTKGPLVEKKERKKPIPSQQGDEKKEWNKVDRSEKRTSVSGTENKRGPFPKRNMDPKKSSEKS